MKKILFSFLMLCCLTVAWAEELADVTPQISSGETTGNFTGKNYSNKSAAMDTVKVSTAEEFYDAFTQNYDKHDVVIKITEDIDMGSVADEWSDYVDKRDPDLQCTIDGYCTVKDSLGKEGIGQHTLTRFNHVLVRSMTNATVKGIKIKGWEKTPNMLEDWYPAMLVAIAENCTFVDVTLEQCKFDDRLLSDFGSLITSGFGLMAEEMKGCTVDSVRIVSCSLQKIGAKVGAIAGKAQNTIFRGCYTDHFTGIFAEDKNAYVGGLVGEAEKCIFEDCVNMASVSGSEKADNVGGFTGTCTQCQFVNCINTGPLSQIRRETFEGCQAIKQNAFFTLMNQVKNRILSLAEYDAIWKHLEMKVDNVAPLKVRELPNSIRVHINETEFRNAMLKTCLFNVAVLLWTVKGEIEQALDPDEMGGISGAAHGSTFDRCFNGGILHCLDAYCGGIVGRALSYDGHVNEFRNCINRGYVQGDEQVGGIVGYLEDGHLYNCLNMGSVDCYNDTRGSMYGKTDSSKPVSNCFALSHEESKYKFGADNDDATIHNVSLLDIKSGRVACELNRLSGTQYFCQSIGQDPCPMFQGEVVTSACIRDDVSITYEVDSLADFMYALFDQYADITLRNDIDFGGQWVNLYRQTFPFRGTINGAGHAIKNLRARIDGSEEDNNVYHWYENIIRGVKDYYALLGATEGATFRDLEIRDFEMALPERDAILVGLSKNTTYENVRVGGKSSIVAPTWAGGLVYESHHDRFVDCTVGDSCQIGSENITIADYDGDAAGMASQAYGSTFIHCVNYGDIFSRTDGAGGIVGDAYDNCVFERCVNNGKVRHSSKKLKIDDEVGGIAATAKDCRFIMCANNGHLLCNDEYGGGIVGRGENVTINNCLNASQDLVFSESTCGGIIGTAKNSKVTNCFSYANRPMIGTHEGMDKTSGNNYRLSVDVSESQYELGLPSNKIESGIVTFWLNNCVDNQNTMPWGQNLQVDAHPVLGREEQVAVDNIRNVNLIYDASDLTAFAKCVNDGDRFACAILFNDIYMEDVEWTPIGTKDNRFRGIFDGKGLTIKGINYVTNSNENGAGLFGTVDANAYICNVTIDENSSFTNNGDGGAAGIVGKLHSELNSGSVFIKNCANHADIKVNKHGGGIFGHLDNHDGYTGLKLYVDKCYNMGTITAENGNSALLCGFTKDNGHISNCWSAGQLRNGEKKDIWPYSIENDGEVAECLVGYWKNTFDIKNCYIVNPADNIDRYEEERDKHRLQDNVYTVDDEYLTNGMLTYFLNSNNNDAAKPHIWQQNLGTDIYPVVGEKGVHHTRTVKSKYGTVCLPYELRSNRSNIRYYTFVEVTTNEDETLLRFKYADDRIPSGLPLLYRAPQTEDEADFKPAAPYMYADCMNSGGPTWIMNGTFAEKVFEGDEAKAVYYVSNNEVKNAKKTTIAPFRAYFRGQSIDELTAAGAKAIRFVIEDEDGSTTALELVGEDLVPVQNGKTYSLMGTQVGGSYRGIVIKNGKKVIQDR